MTSPGQNECVLSVLCAYNGVYYRIVG